MEKRNAPQSSATPCKYILKVYQDKDRRAMEINYIELHNVVFRADGSQDIGPGQPLTINSVRKMLNYEERSGLSSDATELINPAILFHGYIKNVHLIIWWQKAHRQTLLVSRKDPQEYPVPSLLYILKGYEEFFVFALKSSSRPTLYSQLYEAPFHNMYTRNTLDKSNVCLGTATRNHLDPNGSVNYYVKAYMKLWWETEFTEITKSLSLVKDKKTYPAKKLNKTSFTLKDAFR
jgi:PRTRC genetic system protein B